MYISVFFVVFIGTLAAALQYNKDLFIRIFSAFIGTLAAALQYNKDLPWALKRIHELGFVVNENSFKDVLSMYKEILG